MRSIISITGICAALIMLFSGCTASQHENSAGNPTGGLRYLALGDSYTIGTAVDSAQSWPYQLSDSLRAAGLRIDTTHIIATNGWTTTDLKEGIAVVRPDSAFDLVSLLIGVNNQYQGLDKELYRLEFRELLEQAIAFAGSDTSRVFVVSIPNYGVTPFAKNRQPEKIREELREYDRMASDIAGEYGIPFINITPISEMAADRSDLLADDELHPSEAMYSLWIRELLPVTKDMLAQ